MNGAAWLLALATLGVDYGWRLDNDGQLEYIIQIPPTQLETLQSNPDGISSAIPPEVVRHVRRFRIVVGNGPLPKDPLPAFSGDGQSLGAVTPINVDASRVNPAGGEFPAAAGQQYSGFDTPALESTVTPLDDPGTTVVLPGPASDLSGDPADIVDDLLPIPPIPRAQEGRPEFGTLAASLPSAVIRRDKNGDAWRPNVSAPDVSDAWNRDSETATNPSASFRDTSLDQHALPGRELNTPLLHRAATNGQKPWGPLMLTVCALCLSIGGNVYLGWIAWGNYLKFRESFESWRGTWSSEGR
jgi:hypothetical protein